VVAPESRRNGLPPTDPCLIRLEPSCRSRRICIAGRFAEASESYRRVLKKAPTIANALYIPSR
jgi:hypothetical protein